MKASASDAQPKLTPPRTAVTHGWIRAHEMIVLEAEAEKRGMHVDALTGLILQVIIHDQLFDIVLGPAPCRF